METNRLLFKIAVIITFCIAACKNGKYRKAEVGIHETCDTVIYSLKDNRMTNNVIDSLLTQKDVGYCYFEFSKDNDTVILSFVYGQGLSGYYRSNYNILRFLSIDRTQIPVFSKEDFFLLEEKPGVTISSHPDLLKVVLSYPNLEILSIQNNNLFSSW